MLLDAKRISEIIRQKKRSVAMKSPSLVDVDYKPDLNPMDMYNMEQRGRMEATLKTPPKIDAGKANLNTDPNEIGLTPEEKTRMGRLRKYIGTLSIGRM
jgi:hypothetical protein